MEVALGDGEAVAALVQDDVRVPSDPDPFHLVPGRKLDQLLPEVLVGDRLLRRRHPAAALPTGDPTIVERLHDVLGIGVQPHDAGLAQILKCGNHRVQLHPVVRRLALSA